MKLGPYTTRVQAQTFTRVGDQTVWAAADLIGKLPNGWKLVSFEYISGAWRAVVEGPLEELK